MKFGLSLGKKKEAESPAADIPASKSKKSKPPASGLSGTLLSLALSTIVLVLLLAVGIRQLVLNDINGNAERWTGEVSQQLVLKQLNERIQHLKTSVQAMAASPVFSSSADDPIVGEVIKTLQGLPYIDQVLVVPTGEASRLRSSGLGFASLDLVRRVESGKTVQPEAFSKDKKWFVQYAQSLPVAEGAASAGVLLVIFDAALVADAFTGKSAYFGLVQQVGGSTGLIAGQVSAGNLQDTAVPSWKLSTAYESVTIPLLNEQLFWILVACFGVGAAIVNILLVVQQNRSLQKDAMTITKYLQHIAKGEKRAPPAFKIALFHTIAHSLRRSIQGQMDGLKKSLQIEKEKQVKSTTPSQSAQNGEGKAQKGDAFDEPLFGAGDDLDLDVLAEDEGLLGLDLDDELPDLGDGMLSEVPMSDEQVPAEIFRAYDIRGVVGRTLTPGIVTQIGAALGSEAIATGQQHLCVGYDGRLSSPEFAEALIEGITRTGCSVINIGRVPTPVLYFATHHLNTGSGVMVTGSHNPADYNGFKVMLGGETLSGDAIQKLYTRIQHQDFAQGQGEIRSEDVRQAYLDTILSDIAVAAPLRVVVDAGNGVAGELGPMLIEELGCEVIPLYCEIDGNFPNHHPDPGKPENMDRLIESVREEGADLGIAFDGDGDRIGVVTNSGKIIWPDRLLMLFAKDVVSRNPGADVIFDVKCSRRLNPLISSFGGRPVMWKSGHSLMKAKMHETGALLAGEMSGHIFFQERWFGFDDGLYSAARLLEILGIDERNVDEVFSSFPEDVSTPEISISVGEDAKFSLMQALSDRGSFTEGSVSTIDGIRVDYEDGWGLCRASNTTPALVLRFEADDESALERIKQIFREQLRMIAPDLELDF